MKKMLWLLTLLSFVAVAQVRITDLPTAYNSDMGPADLILVVDQDQSSTYNTRKLSFSELDSRWAANTTYAPGHFLITDGSGFTVVGTTYHAEVGFVEGVTSNIQAQIDAKETTITGAASTITSSNLTADRAVVSNGSGKVAASSVTATELGYVSGATSTIQTQLDAKQARSTLTAKGDLYVATASGVVTRLPVGTDTHVLTLDSSETTGMKWASASAGGGAKVAFIKEIQAANTSGGTCTSGDWRTRTLNTLEDPNSPDIVTSLASNQFVLGAGTWCIDATAPAAIVSTHQCRLQNITDTTTEKAGMAMYADTGGAVSNSCRITGCWTIAGSKTYEIQHRCSNTRATNGFGRFGNFSISEVYTQVEIWKMP